MDSVTRPTDTSGAPEMAAPAEAINPDRCMPAERPLAMPIQRLTRFSDKERRPRQAQELWYLPWFSRLVVFGGGLLLTVYGAYEMYGVINVGVITALKWALLVLFVANFSWISIAFTSGILGFIWLLLHSLNPHQTAVKIGDSDTDIRTPITHSTYTRVE